MHQDCERILCSEAELAQIAREQRMLGDDLGQAISEEIK